MKKNKSRAITKPEHRREEKICIKQRRGPSSKFKTFQKMVCLHLHSSFSNPYTNSFGQNDLQVD